LTPSSSVGFAVGYDSPSQFSREYRRLFGAPPGHDAQSLRRSNELSDAAY
jgi:transcriptional regulator GlxA family with amidase domain